VISAQPLLQLLEHRAPALRSARRHARDAEHRSLGQLTGIISAAAFSFIVQEPSGIMLRFKAMSFDSSRCR